MTFGSITLGGWAVLGLAAASSATAAYTGYQQAKTSKAIAANNQLVADMQATDARARGEKARIDARRQGQVLEGKQRATFASRGLDLSEGTPADILGQTDFFTQADEATARTNARKEAFNAEAQRENYKLQGEGNNPGLSLAGGLLGGAGSVADKWYAYKKP